MDGRYECRYPGIKVLPLLPVSGKQMAGIQIDGCGQRVVVIPVDNHLDAFRPYGRDERCFMQKCLQYIKRLCIVDLETATDSRGFITLTASL